MTELFTPPAFLLPLSLFFCFYLSCLQHSSTSTLNFVLSTSLASGSNAPFSTSPCKRVQTLKLPAAAHFSVGLCVLLHVFFGATNNGTYLEVCSRNCVVHFCLELCKLECDQSLICSQFVVPSVSIGFRLSPKITFRFPSFEFFFSAMFNKRTYIM